MDNKKIKCDKCKKTFDNSNHVGHIIKRLGYDGVELWCPECHSKLKRKK